MEICSADLVDILTLLDSVYGAIGDRLHKEQKLDKPRQAAVEYKCHSSDIFKVIIHHFAENVVDAKQKESKDEGSDYSGSRVLAQIDS